MPRANQAFLSAAPNRGITQEMVNRWAQMLNAAKKENTSTFSELFEQGGFNSLGGLGGAWTVARNPFGKNVNKPKNLSDFKLPNKNAYKHGNHTYMRLKPNGNVFYRINNKTKFYKFKPYTQNWQGSYPASFYEIGRTNPPETFTSVNRGTDKYGIKVKRYAPGFNFWIRNL